jgi:hypothetical protein
MVKEQVLFCPIPLEELEARFQKIIQEEIAKKDQEATLEKLLSPEETRKLFSPAVSKVTLHHWAKQGRIKQHRLGGRVFYKYSEVLDSLVHLKKHGR